MTLAPRLHRFAASLTFVAACASGPALRTHARAGKHPAAALAVYPVAVRWDPGSKQAVELGEGLALHVAQSQRYAVFGPSEFHVRDAAQDAVLVLSDLALVVPSAGVPIEGLVVLRGWVEKRQQSSSNQMADEHGSLGAGQGGQQTSFVAHLELLDAASGELLAEVESPPAIDSNPGLQVNQLADQLLAVMPELAPGDEIPRSPWWSSATLTDSGLRIAGPTETCAKAGLRDGDVVVEVAARPASPFVVLRAQRLTPQNAQVSVTVRRAEGPVTLYLPVLR